MYISEIKQISNYRNLNNSKIKFDSDINFLIGENNIGKTNILELVYILLNQGKFKESDFYDICLPVEVIFTIKYDEIELGFFGENFDIEDEYSITIVARQENVDDKIEYYHDLLTRPTIPTGIIKKLNALYYYAQRTPNKEIDFRKMQGSGRVLNYLIKHSLKTKGFEEKDVLRLSKINQVVAEVNGQISSLNLITGDSIQAYVNEEPEKVISNILGVGDQNGRELENLGQGIQYSFNILLQILDAIYTVKATRKESDFEKRLIITSEGKKLFPIFLILDEPEIHQHPYRQRDLMKKIQELLQNTNLAFVQLLKDLFNIDGLVGQIFIATHSPSILLNNYQQFIRIYKPFGTHQITPSIISGKDITISNDLFKHLLRNFTYLKEAMFSKCIVFVEGDTENGAFPIFAEREGLNLDEKGIGIIKLDGADSVKKCLQLYASLGIKSIAIIDKDKYDSYSELEGIYFTEEDDFEADVYKNFNLKDYLKFNKEMNTLQPFIGILTRKQVSITPQLFLQDPSQYTIDEQVGVEIMNEICVKELEQLRKTKNASKAILLATYVTSIPSSYQAVIDFLKNEV